MMTAQLVHARAALSVRTLSHNRLAQAFPLAAACDPALTLAGWLTTATPRAWPGALHPAAGHDCFGGAKHSSSCTTVRRINNGTILSAETPGGHIRGLCVIAIKTDAELGRHLAVERVATPALGRATIAGVLHAEALALAGVWHCPSMALTQTRAPNWLVQFLLATGYRPVRERYVRILTKPPATERDPH